MTTRTFTLNGTSILVGHSVSFLREMEKGKEELVDERKVSACKSFGYKNDINIILEHFLSGAWTGSIIFITYHAMEKFSSLQIDDIFLIFPEK